ncbi:MAG TPA: LamG domain-containing protein [Polyangiaceae bacterium]|nr:LamG domain-containing protein [Polyangiaceae bacterium]
MVRNSRALRGATALVGLFAGLIGSSSGCSDGGGTATGGSPATGGTLATGGAAPITGGTAPTTGGTSPGTGGAVTGGAPSTGGVNSAGTNTGGTAGGAAAGAGTGGLSAGSGGAAGSAGAAGNAGAGNAGTAGMAGTAGAAGTAGTAGSATGGAGGGASGGTAGSAGKGGAAGSGGNAGGTAGAAGTGGSGGAATCAGNAVSLSANGTGKASDAAHARVMVDLMTDLPIGNANRTLEFWAYVRSTDWVGETNTIFEYGTQGATAAGFGLDFGGNVGSIDPYTNGGFDNDNQATGLTTSMDQWVHFAMTWDGSAVRAYVNGVVKSTKAGSGATTMLATARTELTIGCNNPRFSCFGGYIDEFRVWNVARSASEIMSNYNKGLVGNETGLVGYWRFNETSGTTAADSVTTSGHTKHAGTLTAVATNQTPTFVPSTVPITCP